MKLCINCKSEIAQESKFCPICGSEQSSLKESSQNIKQTNINSSNQNVPRWLLILIVVLIVGTIFIGFNSSNKLDNAEKETSPPKYDTSKIYNMGETLNCPNFDITIDNVQIKTQGTYYDSYSYVTDPEWIAVTVTVNNKSNETKMFSTFNFDLINSNGEIISPTVFFYNVWGIEKYDSPELVSGGTKTGFIPFTNTNQNNSNLILKVDCNTGLFEDDVIYKVNISQ